MKKKLFAIILSVVLVVSSMSICFADTTSGSDYTEINSAEDLFEIKNNPDGAYILMRDIDLNGFDWEPFVFRGMLDGNGHAILNASINKISKETRIVYDCNHKPYDAHFSGLFSCLENAEVKNLQLLGESIELSCGDESVFTGLLAGYMYESRVSNIDIKGCSSLSTSGHCWGSGGIAGYGGESEIRDSSADTVLINVDNDLTYRDEQFMGGAYALGYIDLSGLDIKIDGYDMDHGFVHDGGLVGSYYKYDGDTYKGNVSDCNVSGMITFYEDNTNRRAYCSAYIGEIMQWTLSMDRNSQSFTRNEVFDYSSDLKPHWTCTNHDMTEEIIASDRDNFGYTHHECKSCAYEYDDAYRLKRVEIEKTESNIKNLGSGSESSCRVGDDLLVRIKIYPYDASVDSISIQALNNADMFTVGELTEVGIEDGYRIIESKVHVNSSGKDELKISINEDHAGVYFIHAYPAIIGMLMPYTIYIAAILVITLILILIGSRFKKKKM